MYRLLQLTLLFSFSFSGYSQKNINEIVFIDSLGNIIESNESYFVFKLNNQIDTIKLDHLYDDSFTRSSVGYSSNFFREDSEIISDQEQAIFCTSCNQGNVKIVDSIDINQDGFKELIILRKWHCSVSPPKFRPYGVGTHQQSYSQYEVWDVHVKKSLFEIKNVSNGSVAVSTNVMRSYGYSFKVEIDKKGSFSLSEFHGVGSGFEVGKYVYDTETERYRKE